MTTPAWTSAVETLARLETLPTADALAQIEAITTSLPSCSAPERLGAIAAALPRRVAGLAAELTFALAGLAFELVHHLHHRPRLPEDLSEDLGDLSPALRVVWLRVVLALAEDPAELEAIDDALLLRTLIPWPRALLEVTAPAALLDRMALASDPRLRALAIERLAAAVQHVAITPARACACLLRLARDPQPGLRRAALKALRGRAEVKLAPALEAERRSLIAAGLDDARQGELHTELAVAFGDRDLLVDFAFDEACDPGRRATVLRRLGDLAEDGDLAPALALLEVDSLLFGPSLRTLVLQAHRRGVFIHDAEIPALLRAYDSTPEWTGDELMRVTHVARHALLAELARLPVDDRRWVRRARILAAAVDTDAHEIIAEQLGATTDERIASALIDAAGRSPDFADEDALLAWLPRLPEPVITALYAKGTRRSINPLRELVLDRRCPTDLRRLALPTLWALIDDRPALLRELCRAIGPSAAGLFDSSRLSARDPTAAKIFLELGERDDIEPLAALKLLCEAGKPELLPAITRLFRLVFSDCVNAALAGDFTIKRLRMPELEQLLYRYGRHLLADGRRVRSWIEDQPETGDALVLRLAIEWLREDPPAPICVALLETVARKQASGSWLQKIRRYWRHADAEVKRAALEAILAGESDEHGLTLSIGRLAAAKDPRIVRQALIGIKTLRARWAEPLVIAALARPEMAIKREAALTLAAIGSGRCLPSVVEWLAIHDNSGFRADLLAALRSVADKAALAILLDALAQAEERRERELLCEATDGLLTIPAAIRLARAGTHLELIEEALAGRIGLAEGDARALATALHRLELRVIDRKADPLERLRLDGFSPALALAAIERRDELDEAELAALIRRGFAEWLGWIAGEQAPPAQPRIVVLERLLALCGPEHRLHVACLLEQAEQARAELRAAIVVQFLDQRVAEREAPVALRARGLALLRAMPASPEVGGLRRYQLLGKLGAVRGRADLDRCLADCRIGPNVVQDSRALLTHALAIPAEQADEIERLDDDTRAALERLREGAKSWYRLDEREAERWVSEQLEVRPLEVSPLAAWPWPIYFEQRRPPPPSSLADLHALLEVLADEDRHPQEARERAAEAILSWPAAALLADARERVLAAYLDDAIDLSTAALAKLAAQLEQWPTSSWSRTRPLFEALDLHQRRRFLPDWIAAWERAEPDAEALLRALDQELLIPTVRTRAEAGDYVLLRLLRPSPSSALRELIELVTARAPDEVAHLVTKEPPRVQEAIVDPIGGKSIDELLALLDEREFEVGLAVRAIHRLAELASRSAEGASRPQDRADFGDDAGEALASFTRDRRPRVRSAALRALRGVVSRERRLAAALDMLEIETRRDVVISLLETLAHGRYEPGFSRVAEYLGHRDDKLRDAAARALLAWGPEVEPLLRRAARKARPDRRRIYDDLLAKLGDDSD